MTLSRTQLKKELDRTKEWRKTHDTRYMVGYEDALRWVYQKMRNTSVTDGISKEKV